MKLKKFISLHLFVWFLLLNVGVAQTVLIDPGHGGEEYGAQGKLKTGKVIYEKDIALLISKKVLKKVRNKYKAYMTRSIDRTVPLNERAELAHKVGADLFVSIHINSNKNSKSNGFETYFLNNKRGAAVRKVEKIENGKAFIDDPEVDHILTDILIANTVDESKSLAGSIHKSIAKGKNRKFRIKNRGVKPGLFYVLALSKVPGVLLELGFISNNRDLKKLLDPKFQDQYAQLISDGIFDYLKSQKK